MSEQKQASFFVGNHNSALGIGDWLRNFGKIFEWHGWELLISSRVDQADFVVVLDEFSNSDFTNAFIRWSKDRPEGSKLIVALSEFMSVRSDKKLCLNTFEHWTRELRPNRDMIKRPHRAAIEPLGRSRYLAKRAAGLERVIREAKIDMFAAGHPAISEQIQHVSTIWGLDLPPVADVEHPALIQGIWNPSGGGLRVPNTGHELATSFNDDLGQSAASNSTRFALPVAIQGFSTPYRRRVVREMANAGIRFSEALTDQGEPDRKSYWAFDFVVPRTNGWPFTSPFRLLRAHSLGLIPIGLESWWPEDHSNWRLLCLQQRDVESVAQFVAAAPLLDLDAHIQSQRQQVSRQFGSVGVSQWARLFL